MRVVYVKCCHNNTSKCSVTHYTTLYDVRQYIRCDCDGMHKCSTVKYVLMLYHTLYNRQYNIMEDNV